MSSPAADITSVLKETRQFPPPAAFAARAHIKSLAEYETLWQRARDNPEAFWAEIAGELEWFTPWKTILEWKPPFAKWFVGATTNLSHNCLDRHLNTARRNKAALMKVLGPLGVTNDRLDEVSNYYRYRPQLGEMWPTTAAKAHAVVEDGKVKRIVVTSPGSGYSTLESASIALEDSLGGNGNYIDGATGSKLTFNGMLTTNRWPGRHIRF